MILKIFSKWVREEIKNKENDINVSLTPNPDIIASIKGDIIKIAFAAEINDMEKFAMQKLKSKKVDFIIANDVSNPEIGFNSDNNKVIIFSNTGDKINLPLMPKIDVGHEILDSLKKRF